MNFNIKFLNKLTLLFLAFFLIGTYSCEIDEVPNPNSPDLDQIINNASRGDLNVLVTGIESLMTQQVDFYYDVTGIIGREFYFFTNADTRYTGEVLGKGNQELDNAGFYGTRPFQGRYRTVKNANILIAAATNQNNITNLALTDEEVSGFLGFAKAAKAYELQLALNLQYENGIRLDVSDPDNLGPFLSYDQSVAGILDLIDESLSDLSKAGGGFAFPLSSGYAGFDTPSTFAQYVNGVGARIALYANEKSRALAYLQNSFLDLDGNFNTGPERFYSTAGGEQINELFRVLDQAEALIAHPDFVAALQANPGDLRNSKIVARSEPASSDDLTGTHDVFVYKSFDDNLPLIRNEELILIYAEANIGTNNAEALNALNIIRTGNSLDEVNLTSDAELIDELLEQRRFSLFFEGHRWVDMRRYNRLDQLPIDRPDDDVWLQFPRPVSETP